tara:strand:- start:387 stop:1166 length:780 start_codon:yes stop_codon:yes gene_type:complete
LTLKKRLILNLFYLDGYFCLSRNFRLQKVGDINWLLNSYPFKQITKYIDELSIINVSNNKFNEVSSDFLIDVDKIISQVFVPLTLGGGLRTVEHVEKLFNFGADKIQLNQIFQMNPEIVDELSSRFGNQSIIAAIDVKKINDTYFVFQEHGQKQTLTLNQFINRCCISNIGELNITSINKDGTGQGYDKDIIGIIESIEDFNIPLVISGGAGKPEHFLEVLKHPNVSGASTANLFNFMGSSFEQVKQFLLKYNIQMRKT